MNFISLNLNLLKVKGSFTGLKIASFIKTIKKTPQNQFVKLTLPCLKLRYIVLNKRFILLICIRK